MLALANITYSAGFVVYTPLNTIAGVVIAKPKCPENKKQKVFSGTNIRVFDKEGLWLQGDSDITTWDVPSSPLSWMWTDGKHKWSFEKNSVSLEDQVSQSKVNKNVFSKLKPNFPQYRIIITAQNQSQQYFADPWLTCGSSLRNQNNEIVITLSRRSFFRRLLMLKPKTLKFNYIDNAKLDNYVAFSFIIMAFLNCIQLSIGEQSS
ncbi:MAG: hypothetical protein ACTSPV_06225 [Candidatus Hodarchaeales archaeon]